MYILAEIPLYPAGKKAFPGNILFYLVSQFQPNRDYDAEQLNTDTFRRSESETGIELAQVKIRYMFLVL